MAGVAGTVAAGRWHSPRLLDDDPKHSGPADRPGGHAARADARRRHRRHRDRAGEPPRVRRGQERHGRVRRRRPAAHPRVVHRVPGRPRGRRAGRERARRRRGRRADRGEVPSWAGSRAGWRARPRSPGSRRCTTKAPCGPWWSAIVPEDGHEQPAGADREAERHARRGPGSRRQVVLAELDQHRERDVGDEADEQDQRQRGVLVAAQQQRDQRGDQQRVAELDGADEAEPVGDPPAEQRADDAAAELERERGPAERAGGPELADPVERDERVDAEADRGADDLDRDQQARTSAAGRRPRRAGRRRRGRSAGAGGGTARSPSAGRAG